MLIEQSYILLKQSVGIHTAVSTYQVWLCYWVLKVLATRLLYRWLTWNSSMQKISEAVLRMHSYAHKHNTGHVSVL